MKAMIRRERHLVDTPEDVVDLSQVNGVGLSQHSGRTERTQRQRLHRRRPQRASLTTPSFERRRGDRFGGLTPTCRVRAITPYPHITRRQTASAPTRRRVLRSTVGTSASMAMR